jgi:predicted TIM-barrel fold metal-dependent hydrolase
MEIIDAYLHCGIRKFEPLEQVRSTMHHAGINRAVLVQHLGEYDNSYIAKIIQDDPEHFAGVALVDPDSSNPADSIRNLKREGFGGIRLTADTLTNHTDIWHGTAGEEMVIGLFVTNPMPSFHQDLLKFLDEYPDCHIVITHMGGPHPDESASVPIFDWIYDLGRYPNIYLQLSGMHMYSSYPYETMHTIIGKGFQLFGMDRLVWGSNYPVVGNSGDTLRDLKLLLDNCYPFPEQAIPAIASRNALNLYFNS